ncbi:hypothetical protein BDV38DRAFT_295974 [Aspergillus pseudotamarii]|uniref:Enoyl reductase (ER) domain-containing protein n=1 Tax=Aspergillus pseudotamarii TaxID=132259 RepID=A0A5N6SI60_ASPPS|nr:uncharacterized protein BDV38DRAFT_295974 [Aspergillus pseudotamarii]KAE8133579.1 hypothetical protein BDV38DRAFT_295974 [Aspergillus pseudotamarii]
MSLPKTTNLWTVHGSAPGAGTGALKWKNDQNIPELHPSEVLVKLRAGSLNYRDIVICQGIYPRKLIEGVVPGSDGAGEVVAVGSAVSRFKKGDSVVTTFYQDFFGGPAPTETNAERALGGSAHGTFRQYANLNYLEGATLSCAGLTAWNSLNGLQYLKPGDCILTQGTGGVSLFAIQFALATGATVIATTSSNTKAEKLKALGVHHIINYREEPNWGAKAKELSPKGLGCQRIIEVGGPKTIKQSLQAVAPGGHIAIIGFLTGFEKDEDHPSFLEPFSRMCIVRGIEVGNRTQFEEMIRAIEANDIHPVIDPTVFPLEDLPSAFQYQYDQKHTGKVVISIG